MNKQKEIDPYIDPRYFAAFSDIMVKILDLITEDRRIGIKQVSLEYGKENNSLALFKMSFPIITLKNEKKWEHVIEVFWREQNKQTIIRFKKNTCHVGRCKQTCTIKNMDIRNPDECGEKIFKGILFFIQRWFRSIPKIAKP